MRPKSTHQIKPGKVAFFLPSMRGGGAERVMLDLAIGFSRLNFSVDLVLVKAEGPYLPFVPQSINIIDLCATRTYKSLPALIKYLRKERPQSILSTLTTANMVAAWAKVLSGVPVRFIIREATMPSQMVNSTNYFKNEVFRQVLRQSYLSADKIIAVSAGVGDDLQSFLKIPQEAVEIIYNPVNISKILSEAKEDLNHKWLCEESPPVVLAVGRLSKEKDYPTLLNAFSIVRKQLESKLIILGEGSDRARLEATAIDLGLEDEVEFLGFKSNPFPYMYRAKVLVLSSIFEGFPNVLVQALSLGTPVVSTNCKSGPNEILEEGRFGRLVNVGDIDGLANGILETLKTEMDSEKKECLIERGRFFNIESTVDSYRTTLLPQYNVS